MDSARWDRVQTLFHDAVDLPGPEQRRAFLESACGGDTALVGEVLDLIDEDERGATLLERGADYAASRLLGNDEAAIREIGAYRIVRVIGEGGMGIVFLAERTDLGSQAAIKILRDAWLSPARRRRFAVEQQTLAQLNHPAIARLYDAGALSNGTPWIVMEFVDGVSITEYCRTRVHSIAARLALLRTVCDAVQYAHQHLVIHRDLKPSNILVTGDGQVKLVDFGISKQLGPARPDGTLTGVQLGTPLYASPEQLRGEPVGVQTDVFSLGIVLYELLVGSLPFDQSKRRLSAGPDLLRPSIAAGTGEGPALTALGRTARTDLDLLCLTATHHDLARRYQSVEALSRDLGHFLSAQPLDARPDDLFYRAGKFTRRHWRGVAAIAASLLAIIGVVVFYTVRLTVARNTAVTEAARAQRSQGLMLSLFTGGEEAAGPAADLRVLSLVDRGVLEAESLSA